MEITICGTEKEITDAIKSLCEPSPAMSFNEASMKSLVSFLLNMDDKEVKK